MQEAEVAPDETGEDEKKAANGKLSWGQKIVGIVGFLFFVLIAVGSIIRKCAG